MPRSYRPCLIGFFLLVIYSVPLGQTALELLEGTRPRFLEVFTQEPAANNLRAFERELERSSAAAGAVRPWMQYAWFSLLGNPGEKAVPGRDGWMFYRPDVRYVLESDSHDDALRAIVQFRDRLARRGISLLVMPAPGKPSIYPERLTGRAAPGEEVSPTRALLADLRRARVETLDLFETFADCREADPCYLERDTHWTAATARRAAEAAAARIRGLGWLAGGSTSYMLRPATVARRGDLVRMMDSPILDRTVSAEKVRCEQVFQSGGELYRDDPKSPVLVLGDSFLRIYETDAPRAAGFIAHLARALGAPVTSIVNDGGASTLVRQQLARNPALLEGKKVVVWEFVERDIRFGTDGWQDVPLP